MHKPFITSLLAELTAERGARVEIEEEYGHVGKIIFKNGRVSYFSGTRLDINPLGASAIATDKAYTSYFLRRLGYPTPEGQTFFSEEHNRKIGETGKQRTIDDGYEYVKSCGLPLMLKPHNLSQGALVTKIESPDWYYESARTILEKSPVMIVERFYTGRDYRVVVLDGEVVAAYERAPLSVTGDGTHTIGELVTQKKLALEEEGGRAITIATDDDRIAASLRRMRLTLGSIVPRGKRVQLLDNANASTGGDITDRTALIHPDFKDVSVRVTKDLGLRFSGVDIIADDVALPAAGQAYIILEVNCAPGLEHYHSIGGEQRNRTREIYGAILDALERAVSG